jgi:alpha-D-xyloside xylohydrolase
VLTLARSAFSGCQRYGVTVWSGDIGYDYEALRKQITAGLSAAMSGLPFWTTDIGGFTGGDPNNEDYRQLYVRWFQYGAFCPMLRVHGSRGVVCFEDLIVGRSRGENELWSFGPDAERMMLKYLKLRYRLLPYIYSAAYETACDGIPMMRPLVMEFGKDCEGIEDQYMFGPALLVCPVLEANACSRRVYLPSGTDWYDFETHERYAGGQWITADAPLDKIPVFVKAGSILPLCDQPLRSTLDNWGSVTLQVFSGADGAARIYCDDGVSYDYEQGKACVVHLSWDDATRQLNTTIEGDPAFALKVSQVQILS